LSKSEKYPTEKASITIKSSLPKINSKGQGSARKKGAALSFNQ